MLKSPPSLAPDLRVAPPSPKLFTLGKSPARGKRVGIFGTGGIGKTKLTTLAPGRKAFFDLDESLAELDIDVPVMSGVSTWQNLRDAVHAITDIDVLVIDSMTRAEELAVAHTLATVPTEKGTLAKSIEGYGYGKGYQHVFDTFLPLFADLDVHVRAGRNVILIMHDCMSSVPNPQGDDYIRYEPRLQNPNSGKASIRLRLKEWLDHLVFIGYDVDVRDNKAKGSGTRTIYPVEMPHCMAKSRCLSDPFEYVDGSDELWTLLNFNREKK